jgi:hypothetical protein
VVASQIGAPGDWCLLRQCESLCRWWFVASLALVIFLLSAKSSGQDGRRLFHKMQIALGGSDRIAAIRDFEQCVRADTWNNDGSRHGAVYKRTRWIAPGLLRLDQVGPGDSYVLYFNGTSGWEILPDKGFVELAGEELSFARAYSNGIDLKLWLADRDSGNVFTAVANVVTIAAKDDSSSKTEITLDPATFLPAKVVSIFVPDEGSPVAKRTRHFEGWGTFQGVKFPRRILNFHGENKLADIGLREIELDRGLRAEDLAVKPFDLKPEMGGCRE